MQVEAAGRTEPVHTPVAVLEERLRILLPDTYRDTYEQVQPVPMRSAGLRYRDGQVPWDEIWGSFCDLAMAGGPSHRGRLLEPADEPAVLAALEAYRSAVEEICRGIHLVTGLYAEASPVPGWVQMYCPSAAMADWLARAITTENVSAHREGLTLSLPAGPSFRIEKEIKNVVTSVAKTTHYWTEHTAPERQDAIARLLAELQAEAPVIQPTLANRAMPADCRQMMEETVTRLTGLQPVPATYRAWTGFPCSDVPLAIRFMRLLAVCNVFARREDNVVFAPAVFDRDAAASLSARMANAYEAATARP